MIMRILHYEIVSNLYPGNALALDKSGNVVACFEVGRGPGKPSWTGDVQKARSLLVTQDYVSKRASTPRFVLQKTPKRGWEISNLPPNKYERIGRPIGRPRKDTRAR